MVKRAVSVSAVGRGGSITEAVREAFDHADTVEVAVGARSMGRDPYSDVLEIVRGAGGSLCGHHTLPVVVGEALRPWHSSAMDIAREVGRYEMSSYTFHPMVKNSSSWECFMNGAKAMHEAMWSVGAEAACETMFVPRVREDNPRVQWWLSNEAEVVRYAEEIHVSENDGRRDKHQVLSATHRVFEEMAFLTSEMGGFDGLIVDEGRRK